MKEILLLFASVLFIFNTMYAIPFQINYLQACRDKQARLSEGKYLRLSYSEKLNELYHSPEPWQQLNYTGTGTIWYNSDHFIRQDTLANGKRTFSSKTEINKNEILYMDYGDKNLSPNTLKLFSDQLLTSVRYSPAPLINYFILQKVTADKVSNREHSVYTTTINKTIVSLYIRKSDNLLDKITTLSNDELRGDVVSTFSYGNYTTAENLVYPATIRIEKINGRVNDDVNILSAALTGQAPALIIRPADYIPKEDEKEINTQAEIEKYNEHIYFIHLMPVGVKVMLVEFNDFLLVAEAPKNSKNGELIISEAKKIAPGKPVRYFVFGHHHPDYLGGMRAFIHNGTTILSVKEDNDYIIALANAPHTIEPDSLQLQPKQVHIEEIKDSAIITDGTYAMKIFFIGKKSGHTNDYLVYYFPKERLLFEDDLVWINKIGDSQKAGETQAGLYNAIQDLGLDVKTIVQSWGISFENYKTVISFEDVEKSMLIK